MLIFFQIFSLSSISTKSIKSKVNLIVAATFTIKFQTIFIYLNSILFNFVLLSLSKDKRSSLSLSISYLHRHCIFLHVSFSRLHPVALSLSMHSCRTSRVVGVKHFFRPLGYEGVHFHFPFIALSLSRMLIYDMFVSFFLWAFKLFLWFHLLIFHFFFIRMWQASEASKFGMSCQWKFKFFLDFQIINARWKPKKLEQFWKQKSLSLRRNKKNMNWKFLYEMKDHEKSIEIS